MVEFFVVVSSSSSPDSVRRWLAANGGRPVQAYGERAMIVEFIDSSAARSAGPSDVAAIYEGAVSEDLDGLDEVGRMGVAAWNTRQSAAFRRSRDTRIGEGRSWGDEDAEPEG